MFCLNLEAEQVSLMLHAGDALLVEIRHIVKRGRELLQDLSPLCSLIVGDMAVQWPSIFGGVITMPTLPRIIL